MTERQYRRIIRKDDPRMGFVIPKELHEALLKAAKDNCRKLSQEIIARLAATFENPDIMSHDRLMRLIFCSELSYGKSKR